MDYKNKLYKMLRRMSANCVNQDCDCCVFYMEDKCCIKDLFVELSLVAPYMYDDTYTKWYKKWETEYDL